jgi:hypothetical protein
VNSSSLYLLELDYLGDKKEIATGTTDYILKSLVGPRPLGSEWKRVAEAASNPSKDDLNPIVVPLADIIGPKTLIFFCEDVRITIHGTVSDLEVPKNLHIVTEK